MRPARAEARDLLPTRRSLAPAPRTPRTYHELALDGAPTAGLDHHGLLSLLSRQDIDSFDDDSEVSVSPLDGPAPAQAGTWKLALLIGGLATLVASITALC